MVTIPDELPLPKTCAVCGEEWARWIVHDAGALELVCPAMHHRPVGLSPTQRLAFELANDPRLPLRRTVWIVGESKPLTDDPNARLAEDLLSAGTRLTLLGRNFEVDHLDGERVWVRPASDHTER